MTLKPGPHRAGTHGRPRLARSPRCASTGGRDRKASAYSGVAELAVPGDEARLAGAEREGAYEVHRVVATQCPLVRELAGAPCQRFVDADDHERGLVRLRERPRSRRRASVAARARRLSCWRSSGAEAVLRHLCVEIVVTRRGRRVARLSAVGRDEALAELVRPEPARTVEGRASAKAVRAPHCTARLSGVRV
jgi:hypothetical protein